VNFIDLLNGKTYLVSIHKSLYHTIIKEMKKLIFLLLIVLFNQTVYGQNIGLRTGVDYSNNKFINSSIGFGSYLNIEGVYKQMELLFSFDYSENEIDVSENFNSSINGFVSTNYKHSLSSSILFAIPLKERIKIKMGANFNYHVLKATDSYYPNNIVRTFKSSYVGLGGLINFQFSEIFKIRPLNFDIFISPEYLINVNTERDPPNTTTEYSSNIKLLNLQLGLSYKLEKMHDEN